MHAPQQRTILCSQTLSICCGKSCRHKDMAAFGSLLQGCSEQLQHIGLTQPYQQPKLFLSLMAQLRTHFSSESPEITE